MKNSPRKREKKKLVYEYTFISPEICCEPEAHRILKKFQKANCPASDGWIKIDSIIEQNPNKTWRVKARYAKYGK